ncbi:hypothetical protein CRE_23188 [Caenorhabditis remanei]|uniref:Uncharacterized protein n=1 Tax=Caenorhabditis remanei TaxID=31234 RepID=E3NKY4_CAERE|nr:hypothetical protein CRE_23188 [Caenorhabditis remanei]
MPTSSASEVTRREEVEEEGEMFRVGDDKDDEYFHGELVEEEVEVETEEQVGGGEDGEEDGESVDMEKIKQIQQQKMLLVTPIAQKRQRGRPRRQSTSSQLMLGGAEEEEDVDHNNEQEMTMQQVIQDSESQSGPLESTSSTTEPSGRGTRQRHAPKRLNDFVIGGQPPQQGKEKIENTVEQGAEPVEGVEKGAEPEQVGGGAQEQETLKPITNATETQPPTIEPNIPTTTTTTPPDDVIDDTPAGPPPAPRHLANKANGRGRPANPIPPHRRPLPKDLVPPGASILKRHGARDGAGLAAKRKDLKTDGGLQNLDANDAPPVLHPPRGPGAGAMSQMALLEELNDGGKMEVKMESAPEAIEEVVIGDDEGAAPELLEQEGGAKKKEREAGKDLPSEHFPKEKARHVSTRGLHPFGADKAALGYDLLEEEEDPAAAPHQRVLTLQGGSFIEDRIGRADMMEDEEMKGLMKNQYIMEEDGVVYEVDPNDVIEEEEAEPVGVEEEEEQYLIQQESSQQQQQQLKTELLQEDDDDDDDLPPNLIPEGVPEDVGTDVVGEDKGMPVDEDGNFDFNMMDDGETIRLQSPGGRSHDVRLVRDEQGNTVFLDENGHIVELVTDSGALVEPSGMGGAQQEHMVVEEEEEQEKKQIVGGGAGGGGEVGGARDGGGLTNPFFTVTVSNERANIEFMNSCSFLDTNNICCGLCGEIVLYEKLVSEHLPNAHPEYLAPGIQLEEVPYNSWLKSRLKHESKMMENGFRHYDEHDGGGFGGAMRLYSKGLRQMRKVSQIRINANEMTFDDLEKALKRKIIEKMGRKVPVSLVDRLHARCDICQAVVSLNKKFEVVHLVRHFNAWHPAEHRCSQEWKDQPTVSSNSARRPLSLHDFAVVSTETDQNNLQCIWCGMMMDRKALGMHFSEIHSQQIIVPNCSLCLQEMVATARLMEKYGEDYGISLPDEFHLFSGKLNVKCSTEKAMDKAIDKYLKRASKHANENNEDEDADDDTTISITNSQQSFGRRNRLKRKFVKPCFRQICPTNSEYFEAKSACEWKCRLCSRAVYGAVISAGAIKHFKEFHPAEIDRMQYELVKARLERIGDGSMEFVHPQLVECLICSLTYALHKPFNICRAIRHLRLKHPEVMPETSGKSISGAEIAETTNIRKPAVKKPVIRFGDLITDPIELEKFRKENFDQQFDKIQVVYGIKKNNEPAYILLMENETMDHKTAMEMAEKLRADEPPQEAEPELRTEVKPIVMEYQEEEEIMQEENDVVGEVETEFMPTYDANNPDHVLIEENEIMAEGNYEMIQEGDYQEIEEDNRTVRYLTEEEIREAQARGEILEFEEEEVFEEDYQQQ